MTAGVLGRPTVLPDRPELDGGGTLEELLTSALADVRANGSTECPVCHARITPMAPRARGRARGECSRLRQPAELDRVYLSTPPLIFSLKTPQLTSFSPSLPPPLPFYPPHIGESRHVPHRP